MDHKTETQSRKYLGVMPHYSQSKEEQKFNRKHLRAYLKGHTHFTHGWLFPQENIKFKVPKWHVVEKQNRILE